MHKPDLLILDEPTSGLDPIQIIEIRQLIRELGENHTVLLSTHILPEVTAICNRVLIINQGRIVTDGHPEELARSMGEAFQVELEIRGPQQAVLQELTGMPAVETAQTLNSEGKADSYRYRVSAKERIDLREDVFYRMAELNYPILEMRKVSMSLEDIFLKLTTEEPAAPAAGETGDYAEGEAEGPAVGTADGTPRALHNDAAPAAPAATQSAPVAGADAANPPSAFSAESDPAPGITGADDTKKAGGEDA